MRPPLLQLGDLGRLVLGQHLGERRLDPAHRVTDLRGRVQAWNPGAVQMFGYDEEEMLGHPIRGGLHFEPQRIIGLHAQHQLHTSVQIEAERMVEALVEELTREGGSR